MSRAASFELELPDEFDALRLPAGVDARLEKLLDQQDQGKRLTPAERKEAEGLVSLAEMLSLLRLRAGRARAVTG